MDAMCALIGPCTLNQSQVKQLTLIWPVSWKILFYWTYFSSHNFAPINIKFSIVFSHHPFVVMSCLFYERSKRVLRHQNKIFYRLYIACFQILLYAAPNVSHFQTWFLFLFLSVQSYRIFRGKHSSESSRDFGQTSYASLVLSCLFTSSHTTP